MASATAAFAAPANPGGASAAPPPSAARPTSRTKAGPRHSTAARHRVTSRPASIIDVRCVPASSCTTNPHLVSTGGRLLVRGHGLRTGLIVAFPASTNARLSRRSPTARLHRTGLGMVVAVPRRARSGRIALIVARGRFGPSFGPVRITRRRLHPAHTPRRPTPTAPSALSGAVQGSAFDGQGIWIWYLSKSEGGNVASIVARAKRAGVTTLFIKSSDGSTNYWGQFTPQLVQTLHANGLKACAWQYVYGTHPTGEADLGARAVAAGADCLVIDAEAEYEGHYGAAQTYITGLRAKIGPDYPVGLASFPYVDYHPSLPYSVFLGPGGAQFNAPQMYWKDIGTSVDSVYSHTFVANRIYGRPLYPLGQTYQDPPPSQLLRFRELAGAYGARGLSFWDWQETTSRGWSALGSPLGSLGSFQPTTSEPVLASGAKGDQVLWMQEHLATAIPNQPTTGYFRSETDANLRNFQTQKGLPVTGQTDGATWQALLALAPVAVDWTGGGPRAAAARVHPGVRRMSAPRSARLSAVRYEIRPRGAGRRAHRH